MSIDDLPIWALFAGTFALLMITMEVGYRLGRARQSEEEKEAPVSAIAGAILGLGAFLLAFTFDTVADRYDTRKSLVREDANAIRTAWQRSEFLPEPDRAQASALLRQYLDLRLRFAAEHIRDPAQVKAALDETQQLQDRLWSMAVANARKDMNSDVAALYVESLNEVFTVHAARVSIAMQTRIPYEIWAALYCMMMLGMTSVGYQMGIAGSKRSLVRPILALSFTLVFTLIAVLDLTDGGALRISQQPLINLRDVMSANAARADRT